MRVVYPEGFGPAREVSLGSGFWSAHDPVQVLGLAQPADAIDVRWPDGSVQTIPIPEGSRSITVRWEG